MRGEQGTVWPEADGAKFSFPAQSQGSGQGCQLCLQGSLQLCFNTILGKELLIPGQALGLSPSTDSMGTQLASHVSRFLPFAALLGCQGVCSSL